MLVVSQLCSREVTIARRNSLSEHHGAKAPMIAGSGSAARLVVAAHGVVVILPS